jgi:cell division protein FtsB
MTTPRDSGLGKGRPPDMPVRGTSDRAGQAYAGGRTLHDELARIRAENERLTTEVDRLRRQMKRAPAGDGCGRDAAAHAWAALDVTHARTARLEEMHAAQAATIRQLREENRGLHREVALWREKDEAQAATIRELRAQILLLTTAVRQHELNLIRPVGLFRRRNR